MNAAFPRIMTLLRKERGISQKQAAADLHISQALLSHYEKGIRECGLDFVVHAAEYYGVSCDYLLGRAADKTGAMIAVDEIPDHDAAIRDSRMQAGGVLPTLNKKLVVNSLHILFDLLQKCGNKALTVEASNALIQTTYLVFRQIYAANSKNPTAMFSVEEYRYVTDAVAATACSVVKAGRLACGHTVDGEEGVTAENLPHILPDDLTRQYPQFANSLLNLLHTAEKNLQNT
ncbi:MAG: helix-turn-helix transcriptional regulator [Clostridia bacterium]|nr:helix-turn-helix transcriptional regulator [Clostridia bacterium]